MTVQLSPNLPDERDLLVLREIGADVHPDPAVLRRVRAAAFTGRARPRRAFGVAAASVALVAAAGLFGTTLFNGSVPAVPAGGPSPTGPASPTPRPSTATETLSTSAARSFGTTVASAIRRGGDQPAIGVDQYLRVDRPSTVRTRAPGPGQEADIETIETLFVPGDASRPWVLVTTTRITPRSAASRKYYAQHPEELETKSTRRALNGAFDPPVDGGGWNSPTAAFLAGLPRDADRLLVSARKRSDFYHLEPSAQNLLTMLGTPLLSLQARDPALRAAIVEALTRIPGIRVITNTAIGERTGTTIRGVSNEGRSLYSDIVIDPETGAILGTRFVNGTDVREAAWTVTVVDDAP